MLTPHLVRSGPAEKSAPATEASCLASVRADGSIAPASDRPWWERADCYYDPEGELVFGGHRIADLTAQATTPAYFYSAARITDNVQRLRLAVGNIGAPCRLLYAMKSNRFPPVLAHLRTLGLGLDVCSPGEVRHALACGFDQAELSFTAGSLSRADYAALAGWPGVWINADSLTAIRRLAEVSPGREIGLRINPAAGVGYDSNPLLQYAGSKPTKFGVFRDRFEEALELAARRGLRVQGLHCHAGCGFLNPQLPNLERTFEQVCRFLDLAPTITRVNLGGGLGIPLVAGEAPLDLNTWAALVRRYFGDRGLHLEFEPGDYFVKDAGILLTEVTQVEEKGGRTLVGLNAGFNVHIEPAFYRLPLVPVPAVRRAGRPQRVSVVGNINEALDVWADEVLLAPVEEGDTLCLLNAGGYGAAMASAHCLRTEMSEHLITSNGLARGAALEPVTARSVANRQAWDQLYGSTPELVWGAAPVPFLRDFIGELRGGLRPPSRVLDAGTGEGRNLSVLSECGADEIHAVDTSPNALAKIPAAISERVLRRQAPLDATGYSDAYFDVIVMIDVLETLPDAGAVLRELRRILKPGGVLLCNIPGMDDGVAGIDMRAIGQNTFLYRDTYFYRFIEPREAERLLSNSGLRVKRSAPYEWREAAHPGFRPNDHRHLSRIFIAERPDALV